VAAIALRCYSVYLLSHPTYAERNSQKQPMTPDAIILHRLVHMPSAPNFSSAIRTSDANPNLNHEAMSMNPSVSLQGLVDREY